MSSTSIPLKTFLRRQQPPKFLLSPRRHQHSNTTAGSSSSYFKELRAGNNSNGAALNPPSWQQQQQRSSLSTINLPTDIITNNTNNNNSKTTTGGGMFSYFSRVMNRYSISEQQRAIVTAERLYQGITQQASDPRWYGPGRIGRDFRSRHAIQTMHLWFVHRRLIVDSGQLGKMMAKMDGNDADDNGNEQQQLNGIYNNNNEAEDDYGAQEERQYMALRVQEELFDIFWNDTTCRVRKEGVYELAVNKTVMSVQQYTFLHLFTYDHVYASFARGISNSQTNNNGYSAELEKHGQQNDDPDDPMPFDLDLDLKCYQNRIQELKKLVWMHIMVRDKDAMVQDDHLSRIAWYIEAQYRNVVHDLPQRYADDARIGWTDLPDFSNLVDGNSNANKKSLFLGEQRIHPEDMVPAPWCTNITLTGKTYYWNPKTMESRWEKPDYLKDAVAASEVQAAKETLLSS